ncbi:hypothetical protein [Legionella clemsonensis]|uniref:Uncharacterized protein n=1 Tax=Legionella clemsonensis TaxID=1867846 RepID=A0A222P4Y6_9GAMM|nr:hypothetical protein [Legionella clemsonensis]ASQ46908.1 hypothetical protein clem_11855 [Legionella clemsonensis]
MLIYNDKELIKFKEKTGGKNKDEIDGFYSDSEGNEFFVKKPANINELFAELFAGLLIEEFKRRGLITKHYHASFICANYIRLEDGTYALIQPRVSFKELYKIIGTGNKEGSDRHALMEIFFGPDYYVFLTEIENYVGLSLILMISLLIGDYSVHSGNVVCLDSDEKVTQFARIDLGAAFRNFGCKENNTNILHPVEYQGWFNLTALTKGYFLNYKKIVGLFPAIAENAKEFQRKLENDLMEDIIATVLAKIPADLIGDNAREKLAKYLGIASFNQATLGSHQVGQQFCQDLVEIFNLRLKKISALHDLVPANEGKRYRSLSFDKLTLRINDDFSFTEQMEVWLEALTKSEATILAADTIDLAKISLKFNDFLAKLLQQVELTYTKNPKKKLPYQIYPLRLPRCPEAIYLHHLFMLNTNGTPVFNEKELEKLNLPLDSLWQEVKNVLTSCFHVVITIRIAQEINFSDNGETINNYALSNLFFNLKEHLTLFVTIHHSFMENFIFPYCSLKKPPQNLDISPSGFLSTNYFLNTLFRKEPPLTPVKTTHTFSGDASPDNTH